MLWLVAKLIPWEWVGIAALLLVGASLFGVDLITPMLDALTHLLSGLIHGIVSAIQQQIVDRITAGLPF